jgi:hypothetical protein
MQQSAVRAIAPETAFASTVLTDKAEALAHAKQGGLDIEARLDRDIVWVILRRGKLGGLALRMPVFSQDARCRTIKHADALIALECKGSLGTAHLTSKRPALGVLRGSVLLARERR